jgi:hypothetical protein
MFKLQRLGDHQAKYFIYQCKIDYVRIEWYCTLNLINEVTKEIKEKFFVEFDSNVGPIMFFASYDNLKIIWYYQLFRMCVIRW